MATEVMMAIVSLLGTAIGAFGGLRLTSYRIQQLEKKVDEHNNFARRLPLLERDLSALAGEVQELTSIVRR